MESRKAFLIKRGIAVLMFGIVLVQVLPSLADVLSPSPEPAASASPTASITPEASVSPAPIESSSPTTPPSPQPSGSYSYISPSDSPTAEPVLAEEQEIALRIPAKFPVDPRATSVKISPISISAVGDVLMCISTNGSRLWLSNRSDSVLINGNNTTFLTLSGSASDISTLLNSGQGLRVGGSPRVQGVTVFSRAAVVTRVTLNAELCGEAPQRVNSSITALGLGMNTVKNPVPIK